MSYLLHLGTAFMEGIVLTFSPCVLSVLPIILSSSVDGGKYRPHGVILGLLGSFVLFSILLSESLRRLGLPPAALQNVAVAIIFTFALVMIFSSFGHHFQQLTTALSSVGDRLSQKADKLNIWNGLLSGLLVGASLGLVWTPCAGPLIGSAIVQASMQESMAANLGIIGMFCTGVALPMLLVAVFSRQLVAQTNFLKRNSALIRQVAGSLILVSLLFTAGPGLDIFDGQKLECSLEQ